MSKLVRAGIAGLVLSFVSLAQPALATDTVPKEATLTDTSGPLTFAGGGFLVPNVAQDPSGAAFSGPICEGFDFLAPTVVTQPCSIAILHVKVPSGYKKTYTNAAIKVTMSWVDPTCQTPAGSAPCDVPDNPVIGARNSNVDYDLYLIKGVHTSTLGFDAADAQSATGVNPEIASVSLAGVVDNTGAGDVSLVGVPYVPLGVAINIKAELVPGAACNPCDGGSGGGGSGGSGGGVMFGGDESSSPATPRYQIYVPDSANDNTGQQNGEFSIGFNPFSGNIMAFSVTFPGHIYRLTPGEKNALPESAPAVWTDTSSVWVNVPQGVGDPILWTDQDTGRTFAADNTTGPNAASAYAYSDDDGATWNYASLGVAGADHETIGSGPYPATGAGAQYEQIARAAGYVGKSDGKGRATYFCAQDAATGTGNVFVLPIAGCVRSDDGGRSWGPMQIAYDGQPCAWLHGHLHVAPDGTAYLPIKDCSGVQGFTYSTDAGTTWTQVQMAGTTLQSPGGSDPSIGIDADNTLYNCYVNADSATQGHAYVQVGKRNGTNFTWGSPFDLGASHGIVNASFAEAIGGESGRAACGFIGTNKAGNYQGLDFPGVWYLYIATTKDGGKTWTTVNATPNDPVQGAGGVWQQGGSNKNRNLLDFNEITMDDKGRVIFGYDDGCVTSGCIADPTQNDFAARMRVARQTGGITLKAAGDSLANASAPGKPYVTVSADGSQLNWVAPDNGGSDITEYTITRTPVAGGATQTLHPTPVTKTSLPLAAADSGLFVYSVKATNATGTGADSNNVSPGGAVQTTESACVMPGVTVITDPHGDQTGSQAGLASQADIWSVSMAEPYASASDKSITITLKVGGLAAPLQPNTEWRVFFNVKDKTGAPQTIFVDMNTKDESSAGPSGPIPVFEYGYSGSSDTGQGAGTYVTGAWNTDGTIVIKLATDVDIPFTALGGLSPAFFVNIKPGTLNGIGAKTVLLVGAEPGGAGGGGQSTLDSTTTGSYTVVGNVSCANPPAASLAATSATTGNAPLTVNFVASATDPNSGGSITGYTFHFGDGSPDESVTPDAATHQATTAHTYTAAQATPYAATVTATESEGKTGDSSPVPITVASSNGGSSGVIVAHLTADKTGGDVPVTVNFDASTSTDSGGTQKRYTFVYGDGTQSGLTSSPTISYAYTAAGTFHAYVIVSDENSNSAVSPSVTITTTVSVTATPGNHTVASLSLNPPSGPIPLHVEFDPSQSTAEDGRTLTTYAYDFGNGDTVSMTTPVKVRRTYTVPGVYTTRLTVTDNQGQTSTTTADVTVSRNDETTAELVIDGASSGPIPLTVVFNGANSIPATGASISNYTFDFGDHSAVVSGTSSTATHTYNVAGTYTPTLTVTDTNNHTSQAKSATVKAAAPAPAPVAAHTTGGGALGLLTLLPMLGLGLARRRRVRVARS